MILWQVHRLLNISGIWRKQKEEAEQREMENGCGVEVLEGEEEKEGGGSCQSVSIFILRPH